MSRRNQSVFCVGNKTLYLKVNRERMNDGAIIYCWNLWKGYKNGRTHIYKMSIGRIGQSSMSTTHMVPLWYLHVYLLEKERKVNMRSRSCIAFLVSRQQMIKCSTYNFWWEKLVTIGWADGTGTITVLLRASVMLVSWLTQICQEPQPMPPRNGEGFGSASVLCPSLLVTF